MVEEARSWLKEHAALGYFLFAQAIAIGTAVMAMTAYMVRLEARLGTLEIRGSPHLAVVDNRLTVLEAASRDNRTSIDRIVNVMTKELHISPTRP